MEVSEQSFAVANRRGEKVQAAFPRAVAMLYDRRSARLVISFSTGVDVSFPLKLVQGLEAAKPADLTDAQISPSGLGVHFPSLDADLYIPALLKGFLGSQTKKAGPVVAKDERWNTPSNLDAGFVP